MESVTCPTAVAEDRGKLQKLIREVEGALEGGWGKGSNRLGGAGVGPKHGGSGSAVPVTWSSSAPLRLTLCPERGSSVSPAWEIAKSPLPLPLPPPPPHFLSHQPHQPSRTGWDPDPAGFPWDESPGPRAC